MPSRRSVLAFLGLAPVAAPAVIAAAARPEPVFVGVDVTEVGVTVSCTDLAMPAAIRARSICEAHQLRDFSSLRYQDVLREQRAWLARMDELGLVLPCDPAPIGTGGA